LSERVVNYRKRRGQVQPERDSPGNLELDFEDADKPEAGIFDVRGDLENPGSDFDVEIGESRVPHVAEGQSQEAPAFDDTVGEAMLLDSPPGETEEILLEQPVVKPIPWEILVGSPEENTPDRPRAAEEFLIAPLGGRFVAGLADALVLSLGAIEFGIIVWRVCGQVSLVPVNIMVLVTIAAVAIFVYFAVFTAITAATPGLLWEGYAIRNSQGGRPTPREALWRAFGVLVSLSAFMIGFVWAYVDSDTLTWHDRISGTAIIEPQRTATQFSVEG
jgi:uncharacterized RDD family membrane protein YckC